ncbi:MAG: hypothetical protein QOJ45_814 [Verrucomicrobiota bacterium]|jgi:hypothetical protein
MKATTRRWLVALGVVLLLATTAGLIAIYFTPPSLEAEARAMLAGRPMPAHPEAHPLYVILFVVVAYMPALALLFFGVFFRRQTHSESSQSI